MRKRVVALLAIAALAVPFNGAMAQFSFGIFADPQLSWFGTDTKKCDPNGSIASLNVGFTAERYFAQRYAISSGLSLNGLGGSVRFDEAFALETKDGKYTVASGNNLKFKAQYITMPLGFKFRTNQIGYTTYYAALGLRGNIRLKGVAWESSNGVDRETATDHFTLAFLSHYIGAGMEYSLGAESAIQLGVAYSGGLTKFLGTNIGSLVSHSLSLRVGVVF